MSTRYFEIKSPRADFTGRVGAVSFADGVARVSFDDTRDDDGRVVSDEHQVSVGRSAVMFAKRRKGYVVTEVDAAGKPLPAQEEVDAKAKAKTDADAEKAAKAEAKAKTDAEKKAAADAAANGGTK